MVRWIWIPLLALPMAAVTPAGEPTAHDPQYDNREIWPAWVEKTDFVKQEWPAARVLVWANPGESNRNADPADARNWLEGGPEGATFPNNRKRASEGPDENTDVVFPASGAKYSVSGRSPIHLRHVTVGEGVRVRFKDADIHGNLWIKRGGWYGRAKGFYGAADRDTFCRNDNDEPQSIANMLVCNKRPGNGTEWMGTWYTGDEVNVFSGKMIVAPGSTFLPTDRRSMSVRENGMLVLLSGSTLHLRGNQSGKTDLMVRGRLLAGTPQRPLTRDCVLGLSSKSDRADMGLIVAPDAEFAVHSADARTARLVFRWHRKPAISKNNRGGKGSGGISMLLAGKTRFDAVEFNDVLKGGIRLTDRSAREAWKSVTFGEKNFGLPSELVVQSELTDSERRACEASNRGRWNPVREHEKQARKPSASD